MKFIRFLMLFQLFVLCTTLAVAQAPPPEPLWKGSFGAGLAMTGGNSDTANYNLTFDLTRDPKTRNLLKAMGLYLRGDQNNETTVNRLRLGFRDEYTLSDRTFLFGELSYLRDPFKSIDYLVNPVGGVGYKLYATDRLNLAIDGGLGVVWEKNPGVDVNSSGTVNAGENFSYKLSETASINQVVAGLWRMDDFSDALYHFGVGVTTSLTKRSELKVEFIEDFKNVTPSPEIKKSDTAFIVSFLFKL
jgi:putative salt-induced outer membrane protein YdiY